MEAGERLAAAETSGIGVPNNLLRIKRRHRYETGN